MNIGKISKINKRAGGNKAIQVGNFQKTNDLCSSFIRCSRVHKQGFVNSPIQATVNFSHWAFMKRQQELDLVFGHTQMHGQTIIEVDTSISETPFVVQTVLLSTTTLNVILFFH